MSTKTVVSFEKIAPAGSDTGLRHQYGINWEGVGAVDIGELIKGDADGYNAVIHGRGVGFTFGTTDFKGDDPFSLRSGHFAAAWSSGLTVTFSAYVHHVLVGSETFILDQTDTILTFDKTFKHIDEVTIVTSGGTLGTGSNAGLPADVGAATALAMEHLKIVFDTATSASHHFPHASEQIHPVHDWI